MESPPIAHPQRAWFAFVAVIGAWGSSYLFITYAIDTCTPLGLSATRFGVAGAVCAVLSRVRGEAPPARGDWWKLALIGSMMMSASNALTAFAQATVASGISAVVHSLSSVWLALFAATPAFGREKVSPALVGGVIGGVGGIAILLWPEGSAHVETVGASALVLATWIFCVASLLQRKWRVTGGLFACLAGQMLAGSFVSSALAVFTTGFTHGPWTPMTFAALTWLTFVSSIAGFASYGVVLHAWPPARVGTFAVLSPMVAVLLGVLVRGETFTTRMAIGVATTLTAVAWVQTRRR